MLIAAVGTSDGYIRIVDIPAPVAYSSGARGARGEEQSRPASKDWVRRTVNLALQFCQVVSGLAVSPDGRLIATATGFGSWRLLEVASGEVRRWSPTLLFC